MRKPLDICGDVYGYLTVISKAPKHKGRTQWRCVCTCGKFITTYTKTLRDGSRISCGCHKVNSIDETGNRYGSLLVLHRTKTSHSSITNAAWLCLCDCGQTTRVIGSQLRAGKSTGCLSCSNSIYSSVDIALTKNIFHKYLNSANKRQIDFQLLESDVADLIRQSCFYCGSPPNNKQKIRKNTIVKYSGIDRRDNSIGYILDNCVPCCKICNTAKLDLSEDQFISHIKKIQKHYTANMPTMPKPQPQ